MCESAFTPSERTGFERTRPEGKAPTLVPAAPSRGAGRRGVGAAAAGGRAASPEPFPPSPLSGRSRGDHCLGAGEGFQGSLLLDLAGKPGGKFLAARGRCGRELGTAGHGGAALLLPSALVPGFSSSSPRSLSRMLGNIKSDLQLSILPPPSCPPIAQRVNSFSLKPSPSERAPTKTKLNKTPTENSQTKNITDYSRGRLSPLPHTTREISVYACIETCRETPHIVVFLLLHPGNKINHQNRSQSSSEMFSTDQNKYVLWEAFFGSSPVSCVSALGTGGAAPFLLALWQPLAFPLETAFLAVYLPDRNVWEHVRLIIITIIKSKQRHSQS